VLPSQIADARRKDEDAKVTNRDRVNHSKYRKQSSFKVGDQVLVRNFNRSRKFQPLFMKRPYNIVDINRETMIVTVSRDGSTLNRHPDDLKPYHKRMTVPAERRSVIFEDEHESNERPPVIVPEEETESSNPFVQESSQPLLPRRSQRIRDMDERSAVQNQ
jgi:hypothetical protein